MGTTGGSAEKDLANMRARGMIQTFMTSFYLKSQGYQSDSHERAGALMGDSYSSAHKFGDPLKINSTKMGNLVDGANAIGELTFGAVNTDSFLEVLQKGKGDEAGESNVKRESIPSHGTTSHSSWGNKPFEVDNTTLNLYDFFVRD